MGVETKDNAAAMLHALVVPFICNPLTAQPIDDSSKSHNHLFGLDLAHSADASDVLEVDVPIGSDWYWNLFTGRIIKGDNRPTAIHTKVRWFLSEPVDQPEVTTSFTFTTTHVLKIETCSPVEDNLDDHLKRFWELESLGVSNNEMSVYERFVQEIKRDGHRYEN